MNFKSFLLENQDYMTLLEGTMSDIHQLASDSKDIESFAKDFFKQFGAKIKKTTDSVEWVKSLYNEVANEAYDGNMKDFKYEFPNKFEEATGNSVKAIKKISKKGKSGYEVRTSTYMSEPEMKLVADAMGMELKSYEKSTNIAISVFESESLVNEAKFKKGQYIKAKKDSDNFDGDVYDKTNDVDGSEILKNSSFEIYEIGKDEVILWSDADEVEYSIDPDDLKNFVKESVVNEAKSIKVTKKEWPYVEFKIGSKKHKVEFDYEDIIDNHGNEGQDQYWLGKDDDGKEWSIDVYADYNGDVEEVHYDTIVAESLVTEKFNFSKKEVEAAANLIASAISQADKVKAKVHDLEYDKGRGAGFEISIDGEKYDGGSYVVRDNGDVVNAAIGNSHPNAVYNTIGNKDIADVFINMEKYESLVDESVDAKDIVKTIKAVSKMHDTKFMNPFLMHEEPTHIHKELGPVKIHPGVPAYDWRRKGEIAVSTSLKGSKDWQFTGVDLKDLSELPKNFKLPKQWLSESVTELTWDSLKESLGLTEAKFNKKSLMKAMKADDGMVQLGNGKEYVIYAYDNGNDDNDDMWGDKTIFGLDQDGEEHEIEYSDIVSYNESTVNEGRSINKISKELEKTVLDMKKTVDEWKIAEGDRKSELLEKLRELNKNKVELSKELDSAVAGKDHDLQLAITEAEELAYLELDVINILND